MSFGELRYRDKSITTLGTIGNPLQLDAVWERRVCRKSMEIGSVERLELRRMLRS